MNKIYQFFQNPWNRLNLFVALLIIFIILVLFNVINLDGNKNKKSFI